jgi:hypothetical protein
VRDVGGRLDRGIVVELAFGPELLDAGEDLAAKHGAQDVHGEEEVGGRVDPASGVRRARRSGSKVACVQQSHARLLWPILL